MANHCMSSSLLGTISLSVYCIGIYTLSPEENWPWHWRGLIEPRVVHPKIAPGPKHTKPNLKNLSHKQVKAQSLNCLKNLTFELLCDKIATNPITVSQTKKFQWKPDKKQKL